MGFLFAEPDSPWLSREWLTKLNRKAAIRTCEYQFAVTVASRLQLLRAVLGSFTAEFRFCRNGNYNEKDCYRSCRPYHGFHVCFGRRSGRAALYQGTAAGRVRLQLGRFLYRRPRRWRL